MSRELNILRKVFLAAGGNDLQLVDIHFDETIRKIRPLLERKVPWSEIDTPEKRQTFIHNLAPRLKPVAPSEIDGRFLLLMPGAIDPHVHFDTPGFEFREDFEHGSLAALWGGVTTVIDMPCTSLPPVTSFQNLQIKWQALQNRAYCDYALWGGINGLDFNQPQKLRNEIERLIQAGVVGFKAYLISGMDTFSDLTAEQMLQAARWLAELEAPLAVHAEDKQRVVSRRRQFQARDENDWRAYCRARDVTAEAQAVSLMSKIAKESQARVHIVHLSSRQGLDIVRQAREKGLAFSAETCPHYLFFTQEDFENPAIRNFLKTAPPVKFAEDRAALWQGLADGSLQFVTTDHAGCDPEQEKTSENFWQVYGGIPGVEHRVPFLLSEGFLKGRLSLEQTVRLLSENVAHFFALSQKGALQPGKDSDMALINLWNRYVIRSQDMHSKGRYTPFEGLELRAHVVKTFLRGQLAVDFETRFQMARPTGQYIARS